MLILRLQGRFVELLRHETTRAYPVEACALLFGQLIGTEAVLEKVVVTQNRLCSRTRFEVDPAVVALAVTESEKEGLDFVGLFHSHPAPAVPSVIDQKFMRLWPGVVWLILSSTDYSMSAFRLVEGEVKQVAIRIE